MTDSNKSCLPFGETIAEWTERQHRLALMLEVVSTDDPERIEDIELLLDKRRTDVVIHLLRTILECTTAGARDLEAQEPAVTLRRLRAALKKKKSRRSLDLEPVN